MPELILGSRPEPLRLILAPGYPFACALDRADASGTPEPWGEPPTLTFADGSQWVATLDGSTATFGEGVLAVGVAAALTSRHVTLSVGGVLWARGFVEVLS